MSCPKCPCSDCERERASPPANPWDRIVTPLVPSPLPWSPQLAPPAAAEPYEECAIARFFRDHPDEKSVMMVCFCRKCTTIC